MTPSYLFFGSRNRQKDYYYGAFWEHCQDSGVLAPGGGLVTAFSRDQQPKTYVQHRIREHAAVLWAILQQVRHAIPALPVGSHAPDPVAALCKVAVTLQQWSC